MSRPTEWKVSPGWPGTLYIMPGEEIVNEQMEGSWLTVASRFAYKPAHVEFKMERMTTRTVYHAQTPARVREILETYGSWNQNNRSSPRLRLHYGDAETGLDWMDEFDMEGYISRSGGRMQSPILVHNSRSSGGGGILDHCIVRIRLVKGDGSDLYRHPTYHVNWQQASEWMTYPNTGEARFARHWGRDILAQVKLKLTAERIQELHS